MSTQTPPTLEELARKALLRNQAFTISVLEDIPIMFIPELFKDAFIGRFTSIVKAMVAAWPFPYLPVGSLIKTFNLRIFEDLLDELDVLPTEDMPPKRGKLQELDFRNVRHAFWTGAISLGRHHSAVTVSEKRLKVKTDLYFKYELDEDEIDFLEWVQQFKDSILLCCVYLKIVSLSLDD
ncbi:PRAME family member 12-like, partial [Sigmodon hispidus]